MIYNINNLNGLAAIFRSWNEHKSKQAIYDLMDAVNAKDKAKAEAAINFLRPWIDTLNCGDAEGQYWAEQLQEAIAQVEAMRIPPQQLNLF